MNLAVLDIGEQFPYGFVVEELERRPWQEVTSDLKKGSVRAAVVLGPPGQGKTRLVLMTARQLARESQQALREQKLGVNEVLLPVVARCEQLRAAFLQQDTGGPQFLQQDTGDPQLQRLQAALKNLLLQAGCSRDVSGWLSRHVAEQRFWLFLDALDEAEPKGLQQLWKTLRKLGCRLVITSRPYGYTDHTDRLPFAVAECRLAPLNASQQESLVKKWYRDEQRAKEMLARLKRVPSLGQMSQSPLLLTLLCWVAERHPIPGQLRRVDLYGWIVEDLLGFDGGRIDRVRAEQLLPLVAEIAYRWFNTNRGRQALPYRNLSEWIQESTSRPLPTGVDASEAAKLPKAAWAQALIDELEQKGVLARFQAGEAAYVFPHRSFLEYLAARERARQFSRKP